MSLMIAFTPDVSRLEALRTDAPRHPERGERAQLSEYPNMKEFTRTARGVSRARGAMRDESIDRPPQIREDGARRIVPFEEESGHDPLFTPARQGSAAGDVPRK